MPDSDSPIPAPVFPQLLREVTAPLEMAAFWMRASRLTGLPRGDGHPVMFLPGFAMGDEALRPMARAIERLGYAVYGWEQGRNLGLRTRVVERLLERVQLLQQRHGRKLSLVGWSAGGLYARELARARPDSLRRIFTLGSPIKAHDSGQELIDGMRRAFDAFLSDRGDPSFVPRLEAPSVPCTAIHSKSDGVVAWRATLETAAPQVENIAVDGTHLALGFNLEVLRIVADRLALDPASAHGAADAPTSPRSR